jgi:ubiquinone/menaquinone biosynthesis C-methylase UbiE
MHERRFGGDINRLRLPERVEILEVERVVDLSLEGIHVETTLDVGTGSGIFAEKFAHRRISVTGIDPNLEMLKAARTFVPTGRFQQGTVEMLPFKDKSFDLIFLGHVLHESDDLLKALTESKRCAKQRVVVLEWPYKEEEQGPPLHHRLRPEDVVLAAAKAGSPRTEILQLNHMVLFRITA